MNVFFFLLQPPKERNKEKSPLISFLTRITHKHFYVEPVFYCFALKPNIKLIFYDIRKTSNLFPLRSPFWCFSKSGLNPINADSSPENRDPTA
jgi:hypothetical protein